VALDRQAVQAQPTAEEVSKLNMPEIKEESLRNKCLAGRVLKEEPNKELGALSTMWGHPGVGSWLASRWKHVEPFVRDGGSAVH